MCTGCSYIPPLEGAAALQEDAASLPAGFTAQWLLIRGADFFLRV